jgi:hypothetical protein
MKGLNLSEEYYKACGAPMIREKFPEFEHRIAAGLVGDGSECYGFDDQISKDHDWGPGFCLWLRDEDYRKIGSVLQREYDKLPDTFQGFKRLISKWGGGRVGVFTIAEFYTKFIGVPKAPVTLDDWLYLPENQLAKCTNGKVFADPCGDFSKIREKLLEFYPEDVRLVKIAARCMTAAQAGQYNYTRSIRRKDYFAAIYSETQFSADILSLVFLLNRTYAPYYKWRHRAVRRLPVLGEFIYNNINELVRNNDSTLKSRLIEDISGGVIQELRKQGLSNSGSDFLLDHGPLVHAKIKDKNLRQRDVWAG